MSLDSSISEDVNKLTLVDDLQKGIGKCVLDAIACCELKHHLRVTLRVGKYQENDELYQGLRVLTYQQITSHFSSITSSKNYNTRTHEPVGYFFITSPFSGIDYLT